MTKDRELTLTRIVSTVTVLLCEAQYQHWLPSPAPTMPLRQKLPMKGLAEVQMGITLLTDSGFASIIFG